MSIQEAIPTVFQEPISFPKDQAIYQGLSTKLLNWSALETDIANRPAFSGVLEILGPEETIHLLVTFS